MTSHVTVVLLHFIIKSSTVPFFKNYINTMNYKYLKAII